MQGCNDCVFDCHGNLWITAPAGSIAPAPYKRSMEVRIIVQFTFFLYMTCPNTLQKMVNRKNSQIWLSMYATANYWFEELFGRNCFQMFVWKQKCHLVGHSREKVATGALWNLLQLHVYCDGFDHMLPRMKLSLLNYFPWLVPLLTYIMIAYA